MTELSVTGPEVRQGDLLWVDINAYVQVKERWGKTTEDGDTYAILNGCVYTVILPHGKIFTVWRAATS